MVVGQTGEFVDLLVIGGGPAGYSAAIRAAQLGRSVALIERSRIGGVCLNDGCIPSKALLSAGGLYRRVSAAKTMGITAAPKLNFAQLAGWKDGVVKKLSSGVSQLLERYHVEVKTGVAQFASLHRVSVEEGDQFEFFDFGAALVATGSRPAPLDMLPFDGRRVLTPEQALALTKLPSSLAVVGSDYIALELVTAFARLGAKATLITEQSSLLPEMEPAIGQTVSRGLRDLGVDLRLGQRIRSYDDRRLDLQSDAATTETLDVEKLIVATGRLANSDGLGLEQAGVQVDASGFVPVDEQCRTSVKSLLAAGDVTPGPAIADRAIAQGRVAAEAAAGLPAAFDAAAVPLVCFTEPEVMTVGLTEKGARDAGYEPGATRFPFGASGRAATLDDQKGLLQIVWEAGSERVLGVHAAGPQVSELAGEAALAIELGATLQDLALTIHPHPTLSEAIPEAAWLALDMPLHVFRSR